MSMEEALRRIKICKEDNGTTLDLRRLKLKELPPEIGQLQALQRFYVSSNQLISLLPEITSINLDWLSKDNLGENGITFFNNPLNLPQLKLSNKAGKPRKSILLN